MNHFDGLCLKEHLKGNGKPQNQMGRKTLLNLDYPDNLSILDETLSKMNDHLEVLRFQVARIGLKINVIKTKLLRLGVIEGEKVTLDNEKID